MPTPVMLWRHVICHSRNTWLHGDERGFRDRDHRLHSSGDYKDPPPPSEHEGLRRWAQNRAGDAVFLAKHLRPLVVHAIADRLKSEGFRVLVVSCSETHFHVLVELPAELSTAKEIVGRCKRNACGAVRKELIGKVWAAGGKFKPVADPEHHHNAYHYIAEQQEPGTYVLTYRGEEYWME